MKTVLILLTTVVLFGCGGSPAGPGEPDTWQAAPPPKEPVTTMIPPVQVVVPPADKAG